jgi:hypothetical protein
MKTVDGEKAAGKSTHDFNDGRSINGMTSAKRDEVLWDCVCPCCGVEHQAWIFWTGRGVPRVYCPACHPKGSTPEEVYAVPAGLRVMD